MLSSLFLYLSEIFLKEKLFSFFSPPSNTQNTAIVEFISIMELLGKLSQNTPEQSAKTERGFFFF